MMIILKTNPKGSQLIRKVIDDFSKEGPIYCFLKILASELFDVQARPAGLSVISNTPYSNFGSFQISLQNCYQHNAKLFE